MMSALLGAMLGAGAQTGGSYLQAHISRENMDHQYFLNQKSLAESPLAMRQGLEAAGYNPLLAVGNTNSPTVSAQSASLPDFVSSARSGALLSAQSREAKASADIAQSDAQTAKAEAKLAQATSALDAEKANIELEAIRDDNSHIDVDGKDSNPTRSTMRKMYRNSIERSAYTNSREHAIAEDAVNAIHGGSSAASGYQAFQRAQSLRVLRNSRRP